MKKGCLFILLGFVCICFAQAQYIYEVPEYKPAPGQHINAAPWGLPGSAYSIIGTVNGSLSLGAYGGYIVFRFENPVENHPDNPFGVDFSIFGNPVPGASEPGIVYVMKDENGNGLPDDSWYVLAGSDHWFSSTILDYRVTYINPQQDTATDVPWNDNMGNSGFIFANSIHTQPYYPLADSFPEIGADQYLLSGIHIMPVIDTSDPAFVKSAQRAFGYADNRLRGSAPYTVPDNPYTLEKENSGGDAFDIGWAIDSSGNYVDLDEIHFVKVQTGVMDNAGWLGEISTEITGAADVAPDPGITGVLDMLVIKDMPVVIDTMHYQLEVFAFHVGRLMPQAEIIWETNMSEATINEDNLLTVTSSGELEITVSLADHPDINAIASCTVELPAILHEDKVRHDIRVFPNPAGDNLHLCGADKVRLEFFNVSGESMLVVDNYAENESLDLSGLIPGLYLLHISANGHSAVIKLIKQ